MKFDKNFIILEDQPDGGELPVTPDLVKEYERILIRQTTPGASFTLPDLEFSNDLLDEGTAVRNITIQNIGTEAFSIYEWTIPQPGQRLPNFKKLYWLVAEWGANPEFARAHVSPGEEIP